MTTLKYRDPVTGEFVQIDGLAVAVAVSGVPEAPLDGKQYARQNADWSEVAATGGTVAGPYHLVWNGTDWSDPQTGMTTAVRPAIPAFPQAWVVWVTVTDPTFTSPPPLAAVYDKWDYHADATVGGA